jgi:hypothetical protein
MNKNLLMVLGLMLALNSFMKAQKNCPKPVVYQTAEAINVAKVEVDDQEHPYSGTFQIVCSKETIKREVFTSDLLKLVEENRLENEENILVLSPISKVRILSKRQISSPDFHPIEKLYSFE